MPLKALLANSDGYCFAYAVAKTAVFAVFSIFFSCILVEILLLTALFFFFLSFPYCDNSTKQVAFSITNFLLHVR